VFFQTDYEKANFKKSAKSSFQLRHRYYVTEKRHQNSVTKFFDFGPPPIKISGHASAFDSLKITDSTALVDTITRFQSSKTRVGFSVQ